MGLCLVQLLEDTRVEAVTQRVRDSPKCKSLGSVVPVELEALATT